MSISRTAVCDINYTHGTLDFLSIEIDCESNDTTPDALHALKIYDILSIKADPKSSSMHASSLILSPKLPFSIAGKKGQTPSRNPD